MAEGERIQESQVRAWHQLTRRYIQLSRESVKAGVQNNWKKSDHFFQQREFVVSQLKKLPWKPVFHNSDFGYHRRMIAFIARQPLKTLRALKELNQSASSSWINGGLCLAYPKGIYDKHGDWSVDEAIAACKINDVENWGTCNATARKEGMLMLGALSVYTGPKVQVLWMHVDEAPRGGRGHSFIVLKKQDELMPLDPSGIAFRHQHESFYIVQDFFAASVSFYYTNLGAALGDHGDLKEKERLYRLAVAINPKDYLAWNNLGCTLKKQARWKHSAEAFQRALKINPRYRESVANYPVVLEALGLVHEAERFRLQNKKGSPE